MWVLKEWPLESRHLKWDKFSFFKKLANALISVIGGSPFTN
jgi:hypothetical protein